MLLGIDFGNSFSKVSTFDSLRRPTLLLNPGVYGIPSEFYYDRDNGILIGQDAQDVGQGTAAANLVREIKMKLRDGSRILGGQPFTAKEIVRAIYKTLVSRAVQIARKRLINADIEGVVLSVPAKFEQPECDLIKTAAEECQGCNNLPVNAIISEPVAAAIAYYNKANVEDGKHVLVYDLGGGTYDIALVRADSSLVENYAVVDSDMIRLGGRNWDEKIVEYITQTTEHKAGIRIRGNVDFEEKIRRTAIAVKHHLSDPLKTQALARVELNGRIFMTPITREVFDEITWPLLKQTFDSLQNVYDRNASSCRIDEIICVGGSSNMLQVGEGLKKRFPQCKIRLFEPEHAVVNGDAIFAHMLQTGGTLTDKARVSCGKRSCTYYGFSDDKHMFSKCSEAKGVARVSRKIMLKTGDVKMLVLPGGTEMEMIYCAPGEFMMGSQKGYSDEVPIHKVRLKHGFWLGRYEVTQLQWTSVMGYNPSYFKGDDRRPVEQVSWHDCQEFIRRIDAEVRLQFPGFMANLPTEAQWEYACRAGTSKEFAGNIFSMAWYWDPARSVSHENTYPVGLKSPNAWGFYDMHGNVFEWCADAYDGGYYLKSATDDPFCEKGYNGHVIRGGSWRSSSKLCRSACRAGGDNIENFSRGYELGFRLCCSFNDLILDFSLDDNISALCENVERAATSLQNDEDRKTARILRPVGDLSAVASTEGAPRIVVSWTPESSGLAREYRIVRQDLLTTKVSLPFLCETSPFKDTDVVCGVPYKYTVVPCYHGIVVEDAAAESNITIATAPIASMEVQGEGIGDCAVAHVSWSSPTYNEGVEFSLVLERIHDGLRKKINVTYCDGRYLDEDVIAGEAYRYELTLTVSGKALEPIVRDVTIARLPKLPNIRAICYFQEGRHRIQVEWPEEVSEISLSAPGKRPFEYTRDQFSKESVFLPYEDSVRPVEIQAIRRFGQKKRAFGPKAQVIFIDSQRTLLVSIERAPKSGLGSLRFWGKASWGMKVRFDDGSSLPAINVAVENPGKSVRTFVIPVGDIKPDVFFPFPLDWDVKHGAIIDVSTLDCNDHIDYLTSREIP